MKPKFIFKNQILKVNLTLERHQLHRIDRVLKKYKNLKVYTRENFVANVPRIRRVEKQKNKIPRKKCYSIIFIIKKLNFFSFQLFELLKLKFFSSPLFEFKIFEKHFWRNLT